MPASLAFIENLYQNEGGSLRYAGARKAPVVRSVAVRAVRRAV